MARALAIVAGFVNVLLGGAYLAAWLSGSMAGRGLSSLTIKTNASLLLLLSGGALLLLVAGEPGRLWRWVIRVCALVLFMISAATLAENILGWDLKMDQLLAREPPRALGVTSPNRMGVPASLAFTLAGLAVLVYSRRDRRWTAVAQSLSLGIGLLALLGLLGYVYGARSLFGVAHLTAIALPTVAGIFVLGLGLLCVRPELAPMALVMADDAGGDILRRLLVPAILVPVLLGWLRQVGERAGLFDAGTGRSLLVLSFIVVFSSLVFAVGRRLSRLSAMERAGQKSLRESQERYRIAAEEMQAIMDAAPGGILVAHDPECRSVTGNPPAHELLGVPLRENFSATPNGVRPSATEYFRMYRGGRELRGPELPMQVAGATNQAVRNQEMDVLRRDGSRRVLLINAAPLRNRDGSVRGVVCAFTDITERKQAEEAVRRTRDLLSGILEATGDLVAAQDISFRYIAFNRAYREEFARVIGREIEIGSSIVDALAHLPDDRRNAMENWGRALAGEEFTITTEFGDPSRQRNIYELHYGPIRDARGTIIAAALLMRDVTARVRAEQVQRESEERFRIVAENARAVVGIVQGGRFVYANPYLAEISGYSLQEILSMDFIELVHPDHREQVAEDARRRQLGEVAPAHYEFAMITKSGQMRWLDFSPGRIEYNGRPAIVGTAYDTTERKQAEQELAAARQAAEEAKAAAEAASKAKDHFLAVLSHELRTPLTPVVTALSMLEHLGGLNEATRENLDMIHRNVEMEARLIDDLLDVTRIARGKIELDRRPIPLAQVIRQAVEVVQSDIEARRLHFGVDMPDTSYIVDADATRLQQVFWNLLRNAIKFTPHGGCVGVFCRQEDEGHVSVEVRDSGEGIEPEALARIFNAFEQAERSITRQFGGLGLGLTISKALVELHGGTIEAHSAGKGRGASFLVTLPIIAAKPAAAARPAPPVPATRPLRILLVEDHGDTARMIRQLLMLDGHVVERAGDVATALELAHQQTFDLLISDLGLPDRSGLDLMQELRAGGSMIPGIALSGYGQEEDIRRSRQAGFAAHLTKPTSPERLSEAISAVAGNGVCAPT